MVALAPPAALSPIKRGCFSFRVAMCHVNLPGSAVRCPHSSGAVVNRFAAAYYSTSAYGQKALSYRDLSGSGGVGTRACDNGEIALCGKGGKGGVRSALRVASLNVGSVFDACVSERILFFCGGEEWGGMVGEHER